MSENLHIMNNIMQKFVLWVSDMPRFKPSCSATKTNINLDIQWLQRPLKNGQNKGLKAMW